ncbi:MAG: exodeoxyribonuclease VII large subunit [Candidatus Melainabacteria bacterium]|nr:exodeoxyribonuclease VII large subunit [Candidatus Melainabacteria bacterium]
MFATRAVTGMQPYTVSQLTVLIKDVLEQRFDNIYVVGEVSNAKVYPSGHWYFSLKDQEATLPCVCFKNANSSIKFKLEDGLMIVARGKLSVYPPRGSYQMIVTGLEPVGIGEWQLAFNQLAEKLEKEGFFAPERKRAIPIFPRRIGVVTSPVGAALRDILHTLKRRNRSVNVIISPCKVQGEGSVEEIARAIAVLSDMEDVDVIIVARGGGSIEDLWSFNTELVARAVLSSSVPVISGVGHETDVTICDLVADMRAPTPTAAAELVAKGTVELMDKWGLLDRRLNSLMTEKLALVRRQVERLSPLNSLIRYAERLKHLKERVVSRRQTLNSRLDMQFAAAQHKLKTSREKLAALGPLNVLSRGFSVLRKADKSVVRSFSEVKPGEQLEALLHEGKLKITIESIEEKW